ncbi:hypothetical protein BJY01DRAFT_239304 [Aspergillus pseudoustus]|uniref:F-box domain-containing protein n=1 Tax=Aspergillus pseudoustus TaxID=1810923 RepID=A0ABR4J3A3_9EURO
MSLNSLPVETLHQILGYFCIHCSEKRSQVPPDEYLNGNDQESDQPSWYSLQRHALFSICLVSRRLSSIAQHILYHEFVLGYGNSWRSDYYTWDGRLTSFMITIARRRDLAELVKRVYIHPYLLESFGDETEVPQRYGRSQLQRDYITDKEAGRAIRALAAAIEIEKPRRWRATDLVSLLLAALPGLERCSIQLGPYHDAIVRSAPLRAAGVRELPLRTLDISLRSDATTSDMFGLEWRAGALLTVTPHLETLNLHMCHEIWGQADPPPLPNLENIRITFSRLQERSLRELLSSCASLRTFYYETARHPYNVLAPHDHFKLQHVVECLRRHRATLQSVHLDLRQRGRWMEKTTTPISSFCDFPALKYLLINMEEFRMSPVADSEILAQFLPPSIETVHLPSRIDHSASRQETVLLGLADAISRGEFPKLREIRCDAGETLSNAETIASKFAVVDVDFGYAIWWPSQATLRGEPDLAAFDYHELTN